MQNTPANKRKKAAIRFFVYGLMTMTVVGISIICILLILGFQFNFREGTIAQGGLVQFRSFPNGATIQFDGTKLNFKSPGKSTVAVGKHTVNMALTGYQSWQKTITVKAGELKWLNYVRLVPEDITTRQIATFSEMSAAMPSPDRQWYALLLSASTPTITLYDLRTPQTPKAVPLTLPETSYTAALDGQTHQFSIVEWSAGSRYILMRHQVGETTEYIRVDRTSPETAINLTKEFNLAFSIVHFSGASGNLFYGLNGTDIRLVNLSDKTVSHPLVSNVTDFELYGTDQIVYVANVEQKRVVGVYIDDKDTVVRSYDVTQGIEVDITNYYSNVYVAITTGTTTEIIKDPEQNTDSAGRVFATFSTVVDSVWVDFAGSGRFLMTGSGSTITTYDLETDEIFPYTFAGASSSDTTPLRWLDDYYITSTSTGKVSIAEFDGTNAHDITSSASGFTSTLSSNGKFLFSIGKNDTGYSLQSSQMTIQ